MADLMHDDEATINSSYRFQGSIYVRFLLFLFHNFDSNFSFISWIFFNYCDFQTVGLQ